MQKKKIKNFFDNIIVASDHPSPVDGVSTQSNEGTLSLGAGNVETTRLAMHEFADDQGELISIDPNTLLIPIDLEQTGWEIINSKGKVDTAENNANFHQGKYKLIVWKRFSDSNNWVSNIAPLYYTSDIVAKRANSVKPETSSENYVVGNTEPSRDKVSGVRREHILSPKGMICSDPVETQEQVVWQTTP